MTELSEDEFAALNQAIGALNITAPEDRHAVATQLVGGDPDTGQAFLDDLAANGYTFDAYDDEPTTVSFDPGAYPSRPVDEHATLDEAVRAFAADLREGRR